MSGGGDVDAMCERGPGEIRVEQRNDAADARDAEPDGHVLRAVRHQEADGVALGELLLDRPPGISGRSFRERTIRQALAVREEGRRVPELLSELLDDGRQNAIGTSDNRRRQLEGARPRLGRRRFAGGRSHGRLGLVDSHRSSTLITTVHAVLPASTVSTVPVMLLAFDPSRNSTASATSSTSGNRPSALRRATCSRRSPSRPRVISVSRNPGATAFTVTPRRPTSRASDRVNPIKDAFVAL